MDSSRAKQPLPKNVLSSLSVEQRLEHLEARMDQTERETHNNSVWIQRGLGLAGSLVAVFTLLNLLKGLLK